MQTKKGPANAVFKDTQLSRFQEALAMMPKSGSVSVLPDYFIDRFIRVDDFNDLASAIERKGEEAGGGNIRGLKQSEVTGGNAVNLAFALGALGVRTNLITIAKSLFASTLRTYFEKLPNIDLDIIEGDPAFTVAIEYKKNGHLVNVMLSDVGDLKYFDHTKLEPKHWNAISNSSLVCLVNWSAIGKNATALTENLFAFAKEKKVETFFDPADVAEKQDALPELKKLVLDKGLIDYLSMNENEARVMSRVLASHSLPQGFTRDDLVEDARILSDMTGERVDIHTEKISLSCFDKEVSIVDCHKVVQRTITGAGDIWDAADIVGYKAGLEAEDRLALANGSAGLFISRENGVPPSSAEVLEFLAENSV